MSYLLQNSQDDKTLALLVRIISGTLAMRATLESTEQDSNRILFLVRQAHENALREAINAVALPEGLPQDDKKAVKARQETCLERFCHNTSILLRFVYKFCIHIYLPIYCKKYALNYFRASPLVNSFFFFHSLWFIPHTTLNLFTA